MPKKRKALDLTEVEIVEDVLPKKARKMLTVTHSGRGDHSRHALLLQWSMTIS
jgi:hypothetical protein